MKVFQTVGLSATCAFEVNVIVVMVMLGAAVFAQSVAYAFVVQYFMNDTLFQKSFEGSVDGHTIKSLTDLTFEVPV